MDHPTSNNLASWFTKCRCPMCLGATCGERSIRLLGENDCCCVPLCCRDIGYTFLVLTHVVMEDPTSPKNTQHTTHMQPVSCPGTQRWGLRCCTASSAIWVATQVASSHGWSLMENDVSFSFRLSFFFGKRDETKSGNSLRYTTKKHVSPYHVDPIPSVYVWNPKHIYIIQNVFSWFIFVKKSHGRAKAKNLCVLMCSSSTNPRLLQHVPMIHE